MDMKKLLVCEKHDFEKNQFQFLCLSKDIPEGMSRLLCQYCLEDLNSANLILASIDGLKINSKILNLWPPINQQINLKSIQQKHLNLEIEQIELFYDTLREKVCSLIEKHKKLDMKLFYEISNNQDFIQKYYEISDFSQFSKIIESHEQSLDNILQRLEDLIQLKYSQRDQNQVFINSICEKNLYNVADERELSRIQEQILSELSNVSYFEKYKQRDIIQNMVQCNYAESQNISVVKDNGRISLVPTTRLTGQVYSEQKINQNHIYEFIIGFKEKPSNYICIGFEEESLKHRYLGSYGRNSFIFGQINELFCYELVRGNTNLQNICQDEFVETIVIQVLLSEDKFYISDYPQKRAVNCMNQIQYKFKRDQDYYLSILIYDQNTQVDIISSRIISAFTLV